MEIISFKHKNKKISLECRKCGFFSFGLMFRTGKTNPCVFNFKKLSSFRITSFFVFFPFLAVWLDNEKKIIEMKKIKPFTLFECPKKPYYTLIEIPIDKKYFKLLKELSN